jgi:hypothetical protein
MTFAPRNGNSVSGNTLVRREAASSALSCFIALTIAAVSLPSSSMAQERTLWKPVHKGAFREVSTTIISPTSSEIVGPKSSVFSPSHSFEFDSAPSGAVYDSNVFESSSFDAPIGAIETTSDEFDYWLVDARDAPVTGDLRCGISKLRFWHFSSGHWTEHSLPSFVAAMEPSLPVMFFVHGYGLGAPAAAFSTVRYARHISKCSRKFRVVTWAWGSRHKWLDTPWENVQDKSWKSEVQGYYLAHILGQLCPDTQVALVGHSFGCRAVCASLQGLATGSICRMPVTRSTLPNHPYEATLIASGIESEALAPGNRYCKALSQVHRMSITTNAHDRVLLILELVTGNPNIMGLHGPACGGLPIEEAAKVRVHDLGWSVWGAHRLGRYSWSNATIPAIAPSILQEFGSQFTLGGGGSPFFWHSW